MFYKYFSLLQKKKYICLSIARTAMADSERSVEGMEITEPSNNDNNNNDNNESSNKEGELWVDLNGSRATTTNNNNNNKVASKLLQTVKGLQA